MSEKTKMGCGVIGVVAIIVALTAAIVVGTHLKRIEPGQIGIVVDYGKSTADHRPVVTEVNVGYHWQGLRQRIIGYSVAQQTLTMVRSVKEGKIEGDDSVACQDQNGVQVNVDSSTLWRVNPTEVGDLYQLRPNIPLSTIEDTVVRREVRSAITTACGQYSYIDIFGAKRQEFSKTVQSLLTTALDNNHLQLDQFVSGEVYLQQAQQDGINQIAAAQQQAVQAQYAKQQADNEAAAAVAKANGDKQVTELNAQAQADSIKLIQDQLNSSPQYLQYLEITKWDGKMPQVTSGANGAGLIFNLNP